ncbi:MAG: hypothetical protein QXQ79_01940 [Candidatus Nanoarchaeia archaeon]
MADKEERKKWKKLAKEAKEREEIAKWWVGKGEAEEEKISEWLFRPAEEKPEETAKWWAEEMQKRAVKKEIPEKKAEEFLETTASATPEGAAATMLASKVTKETKTFKLYYLILFAIIAIVILIWLLFQGVLALLGLPLYMLVLVIGIILTVIVGFKSRKAAAILLILTLLAGGGLWWFGVTPLGKQASGQMQASMIGFKESTKTFTGPLNLMKQIFTGEYDPNYLWRSDVVQNEFENVKDVGLKLSDVKPIKNPFTTDEELWITGTLNAISFPGANFSVSISAEDNYEYGNRNWQCTPSLLSNVAQIRNRKFNCHAPKILEEKVIEVKVTATAKNSTTVAGKQFLFSSQEAVSSLEDPLTSWGISKDTLKSWQKGDESLNVGIGVAGLEYYDILETYDKSEMTYLLGVNIENPSFSTQAITQKTVYLLFPTNIVTVIKETDFNCQTHADLTDVTGLPKSLQSANLTKCMKKSNVNLNPADRETFFVQIQIPEEKLRNAKYGTFFAYVVVNYDYETSLSMPINIKKATPTE